MRFHWYNHQQHIHKNHHHESQANQNYNPKHIHNLLMYKTHHLHLQKSHNYQPNLKYNLKKHNLQNLSQFHYSYQLERLDNQLLRLHHIHHLRLHHLYKLHRSLNFLRLDKYIKNYLYLLLHRQLQVCSYKRLHPHM